MTRPDLIRLTSAARTVGVNVETLSRLVQRGEVPLHVILLGGTRYLPAAPFADWRATYLQRPNDTQPAPASPTDAAPPASAEPATSDAFAAWRQTFQSTTGPGAETPPVR